MTLDAVSEALADNTVHVGEIADIEVFVHPDSSPFVCGPNTGVASPRSTYDGKFDLPWSVAALLHDGAITVSTYTDEPSAIGQVRPINTRGALGGRETPGGAGQTVNPTGQSGVWGDRHYQDQAEREK